MSAKGRRTSPDKSTMPGIGKIRSTRDGFSHPSSRDQLLLVNEMAPAILLPARFVGLSAEGFLLAVADRFDAADWHSGLGQRSFHRNCALVAQSEVVLRGSAFVAVTFNREIHVGVLTEELSVSLDRTLLVATNVGLVVVEVNILDARREQIFFRRRRTSSGWRRRLSDCNARGRFLCSAGSLGSQMVSGRLCWCHLLRAAGLHSADAINRNVGGAGSFPSQRRRLPLLNGVGVGTQSTCWCRRRWGWFLFAGSQHENGAHRQNECEPFHFSVLH